MSGEVRRAACHEEIDVRGLKYRLTRWGESSADPVVLLHGWMDVGLTWQFLVDCLPDDWSFVAPDWRGFGGSGWAPGGYWFPDYFADLDALLDAIAPYGPVRVIAHSMGGNVASMYAGIRRERLRWLVNIEGVGLPRTSPEQAPGRYEQWLNQLREGLRESRYESAERLADVLVMRNPRLTQSRAQFIARAWTRPVDGGVVLSADPRHRWINPVLYRREEAEACWRRIEIPVLLLIGEQSDALSRLGEDGTEERLRSVLRTARIVTMPDVGHMMHHEAPEAVARQIVEFARSLS